VYVLNFAEQDMETRESATSIGVPAFLFQHCWLVSKIKYNGIGKKETKKVASCVLLVCWFIHFMWKLTKATAQLWIIFV